MNELDKDTVRYKIQQELFSIERLEEMKMKHRVLNRTVFMVVVLLMTMFACREFGSAWYLLMLLSLIFGLV